MQTIFVIRRGDKSDSYEEWNEDRMAWGPEGSFPVYARSEAERMLRDVPKRYKPYIFESEDDGSAGSDDDHEIGDDGYPGDLK